MVIKMVILLVKEVAVILYMSVVVCLFQGTSNSGGSPLVIFHPFTAKVIWYCRYVCSLTICIFCLNVTIWRHGGVICKLAKLSEPPILYTLSKVQPY